MVGGSSKSGLPSDISLFFSMISYALSLNAKKMLSVIMDFRMSIMAVIQEY
jgi:hypothetical protein